MTNEFYDSYNAAFDRVKSDLENVTSLGTVILGKTTRPGNPPYCLIIPMGTTLTQKEWGTVLDCQIEFDVILVVRETNPSKWFVDIATPLGGIVDAILADRTLNGAVSDVYPTRFAPGEVHVGNKLYDGGLIRFRALMLFTP
jgi:hypothetical protein